MSLPTLIPVTRKGREGREMMKGLAYVLYESTYAYSKGITTVLMAASCML